MKKILSVSFAFLILISITMGMGINSYAAENTVFGDHTYCVFNQGMTWYEAKEYCEDIGGHLVTITSSDEQSYIEALIKDEEKNSYWIGAVRDSDGNFSYWITGEKIEYTNYESGRTDNYTGSENALVIYKNDNPMVSSGSRFHWNDLQTDGECKGEKFFGISNIGFICEWDYAVKLSENRITMNIGEAEQIEYSVKGNASAQNVYWETDNEEVAQVTQRGNIIAKNAGYCYVKCVMGSVSSSVKVIVTPSKVKQFKISKKRKNSVKLKWKKQKNVAGYKIYMYNKNKGRYTCVKTVNGDFSSSTVGKLKKGRKYKFKIRSYINVGNRKYYGAYSKTISVKIK